MTLEEVAAVYAGSDGDATRALYAALLGRPPRGEIAMNLFRATKRSERAKGYRRGRHARAAYGVKDYSIGELCRALAAGAAPLGIAWGWGRDEKAVNFEDVLYVDVPGAGQVSFHCRGRKAGPDYTGQWDGAKGTAADRVVRWAHAVLHGVEV